METRAYYPSPGPSPQDDTHHSVCSPRVCGSSNIDYLYITTYVYLLTSMMTNGVSAEHVDYACDPCKLDVLATYSIFTQVGSVCCQLSVSEVGQKRRGGSEAEMLPRGGSAEISGSYLIRYSRRTLAATAAHVRSRVRSCHSQTLISYNSLNSPALRSPTTYVTHPPSPLRPTIDIPLPTHRRLPCPAAATPPSPSPPLPVRFLPVPLPMPPR